MKNCIKGALIGLGIWILLLIIYGVAEIGLFCRVPVDSQGYEIAGYICRSTIQETIIFLKSIIGYPLANPIYIPGFSIKDIFMFIFWGGLIGGIVDLIKGRRNGR
jgi:hypothetical protein